MANENKWLCIPVTSLPPLQDAAGNINDVRMVFYALAEAMYDAYAKKADSDLPAKMTLRRQTTSNVNQIDRSYTFDFDTFINANEVVDENA